MRRCLILIALLVLSPGLAGAAELSCARLFIPDALELECQNDWLVPEAEPAIVVEPRSETLAGLSRLSLRRLDPGDDVLAWDAPDLWLRQRLSLDFTAVQGALYGFAQDPDNPLAGQQLTQAVMMLGTALERLGKLPLDPCEAEELGLDGEALTCRYGIEPLALFVQVRLIEQGAERYAVNIWSLSEQRFRHLQAIANSFEPTPVSLR